MKFSERQLTDFYEWLGMEVGFNDENEDQYLYKKYSGRGMFGKTCLGIVSQDPVGLIARLSFSARDEADSFHDEERSTEFMDIVEYAFTYSKTDSMGRSTIIYFPKIDLSNIILKE